jgi:hypothetical protein
VRSCQEGREKSTSPSDGKRYTREIHKQRERERERRERWDLMFGGIEGRQRNGGDANNTGQPPAELIVGGIGSV